MSKTSYNISSKFNSSIPSNVSDRVPLLLRYNVKVTHPKNFKFERMWLQIANFKDLVQTMS